MGDASRRGDGWRWAAMLCAAAFLVSGAVLVRDALQSRRELDANQQLARRVREAREIALPAPAVPDPDRGEPGKFAPSGSLEVYNELWQENHDLAGWLSVEGLELELPVMYTPEDTQYYLHRSFDGSYAYSGCLFLGEGWTPEGNYAIIYGHNMKNGTMFSRLHEYQDPAFAQEHPVIRFDTMTEEREYAVLGAFYSQAYTAQDAGVFRYYQYDNLDEPEDFARYVVQVREAALYDTGVEVRYGDRLLALSTCSYHQKNGRFVVVAVQKAAGAGESPKGSANG